MFETDRVLTIDPGITSTGWAYWATNYSKAPTYVGLIKGKGYSWVERAAYNARAITCLDIFIERRPVVVHCEMPMFFASSAGGHAAATSDSLTKLCYMVGCYAQAFTSMGCVFSPVTVRTWKGQLPKHVVEMRVKSILGEKACTGYKDDIWDAVGIGLWAMKELV